MTQKVRLELAISELQSLTQKIIDNDGAYTDDMIPAFDKSVADFKNAVSRRQFLITDLKAKVKQISELINEFKKEKEAYELILSRVESSTAMFMKENPDLDFTGRLGTFKFQNNGGVEPLEWGFELRSMENIIPDAILPQIPKQYILTTVCQVLDKKKFSDDVRSGVLKCDPLCKPKGRGQRLVIK